MKYIYRILFLLTLAITAISCEAEDGTNGIDGTNGRNAGLEFLVFAGDITDEDATKIISENFGKTTVAILVTNTTNLTTLELPEIATMTKVILTNNKKLQRLALPNLEHVSDKIVIESNPSLATVDLENLISAGDIYFENNKALTSINISKLDRAQNFVFDQNPLLQSINLPMLTKITDEFKVLSHENLSTLDASTLIITNELFVRENVKLLTIDFSSLTNTGKVSISQNPILETVNLSQLTKNTDAINLNINPKLTTIALPNLSYSESLGIANNVDLQTVSCPALIKLNGELTISNNPNLASLHFPTITSIGSETRRSPINIRGNDMIKNIDFSSLETFFANIVTIESDVLEMVNLNNLTTFSDLRIESSATLNSMKISSVLDFTNLQLPKIPTEDIDTLFTRLVNITPAITGKRISVGGAASAQALIDAETLRTNGNTIVIRP